MDIPVNLTNSKFLLTNTESFLSQFTMQEFITIVKPLAIFVAGVVLYSIIVFKFYRFISRRDIFELKLYKSREKFSKVVFYILEYLILFPFFVFLYFCVLSIILSVISSEIYQMNNIFMGAMAIVTAIRFTAYYNQNLSMDLAKLLPLTLLGVIIIDYTLISIPVIFETLYQISYMWKVMVYYLAFVLLLEIVLRILTGFNRWLTHPSEKNIHQYSPKDKE